METRHASQQTLTPLPGYACLTIGGKDAESFLHGQLSNDLGALPEGGGQLSTLNDPQGRVIALLRIFRTPDGFVAALPEELVQAVAARLRMFVMRSRVSIDVDGSWRLAGGADPGTSPEARPPAMRLPTAEPRWIGLLPDAAAGNAGVDDSWAAMETRNGLPEVYAETTARFVAQMLRLDRLGAVSFTKGCYVGQEVIARAHHLGRVKRHTRLYRSGLATVCPGQPVMMGSDKVGEVARAAADGEYRLVLAVIRDDAEGPMTAADGALERLPDPPAFAEADA